LEAFEKVADNAKKKTTLYAERCPEKRNVFLEKIEKIDPKTIVYIDESGVDNRLFRAHARAPRGEKIYGNIPGKRRVRVSMIGGWMNKKFIAPFTFSGSCNGQVLNTGLTQIFLPLLPKRTTIILDNAAFHKSQKTKELVEQAGCFLLYLQPYSSDLKPIEHCWHTLKSTLRPLI